MCTWPGGFGQVLWTCVTTEEIKIKLVSMPGGHHGSERLLWTESCEVELTSCGPVWLCSLKSGACGGKWENLPGALNPRPRASSQARADQAPGQKGSVQNATLGEDCLGKLCVEAN